MYPVKLDEILLPGNSVVQPAVLRINKTSLGVMIMKVLSIDAWGNEEGGYEWNNWFTVGEISKEEFESLDTDKRVANWFFVNGYTTNADMRQITIEDDQYNIVIKEKKSGLPLFAIEYGPEY